MDTTATADGPAAPGWRPGRRRKMRRLLPAALTVAGLLTLATIGTACGDDDDGNGDEAATDATPADDGGDSLGDATADAQEVEVVVPGGEQGEYAFEADLSGLTAGPVAVSLTNNGALEHQAVLLKLHEGEDAGSFGAAAAADPSGLQALSLVDAYGGPNSVGPGETRSSTQVLEEGDYLLICVIPDETGAPHAAHGMIMPFSVGAADAGASVDPLVEDPADADVTLVDFGFGVNGEFDAGDTIVVGNDGEQAHELAIYRLDDGVTAEEAEAALADETGELPFTPAGGMGPVAPGGSVELTLPEEPGDYVFVCFLPDVAGDGRPHHTRGMVSGVTLG